MERAREYLESARAGFRGIKRHADQALAQVGEKEFFAQLDTESNSIALIVKHLAGNLRSRWTDFLTTDGEKPWRERDREFVVEAGDTKESLLRRWEEGWRCVFRAMEALQPEDLERTVMIRGEADTVLGATQRALLHAAGHVGQIVLLAKHLAGPQWWTLSIPRGKSEEFNREMRKKVASG